MYDPAWHRNGRSKFRYAIYREGGEPLGYAQYRVKQKWDDFPEGEVDIMAEMAAFACSATDRLTRFTRSLAAAMSSCKASWW